MLFSTVKTKTGKENIVAYLPYELPNFELHFHQKQRNKRVYLYAEEFATIDTETSHNDDRAWIYQWAAKLNGYYIYGRKPSEIIDLLNILKNRYNLNRLKSIIFYFHNLSYDIAYLKHFFFQYDNKMRILATDAHTYLIVDIEGFRFICSWKLSNLPLYLLAKNYGSKYEKASGEIDYSILRYQDEELSKSDWFYMFSDVASQHDGIEGLIKAQGYNYAFEMPYTSTGFVRTKCRKASEKVLNWRKNFRRSMLDLQQYKLCHQAFMGGLTICSYFYSGVTVRGDLGHVDFTSSYPARQMMDYFPKGKPCWYGEVKSEKELENLLSCYCCVFILTMYDVEIKQGVTAPCIPSSKCLYLDKKEHLKVNGKIIQAKELSIAVTEIDYKWIMKQYDHNGIRIDKMMIFQRGTIPQWLKDQIMNFYKIKCTMKHSDYLLYMASKAAVNGIYGMTATAIIRDSFKPDEELILKPQEVNEQEELDKFYNSRNSFLPYQYSLYTTAWARDALLTLIETIGYDNFLYCDTDSVFYMTSPEIESRIDQYNDKIRERAIKAGAFVGDNILGVATHEPKITAFRGLHAKCYAMIEEGQLKVTIAGITKAATKWVKGNGFTMRHTMTNSEELENIDNLQDGFIFRHNGGTRAIYIEGSINEEVIDGHKTELASGVIIENIEKEISDTMFTRGEDYSILHIKPYDYL